MTCGACHGALPNATKGMILDDPTTDRSRHMLRSAARRAALPIALAFAVPLAAQEAAQPAAKMAGTWDFSFSGPQGPMTWRVNLQQVGDTLTGQAATDFGNLPVTEGWSSGNEMSFGLVLTYDGQSFTVYFSGVFKGDSAQGSIEVPNAGLPTTPFSALRVPKPGEPTPDAGMAFRPEDPRVLWPGA